MVQDGRRLAAGGRAVYAGLVRGKNIQASFYFSYVHKYEAYEAEFYPSFSKIK